MPHYITLFRFTQKGAESIKQGANTTLSASSNSRTTTLWQKWL